jgi:hypothetical protein
VVVDEAPILDSYVTNGARLALNKCCDGCRSTVRCRKEFDYDAAPPAHADTCAADDAA